jgi:tripartite-type tricarboxylate transporter receptor subunit TctC
VNNYFKLITVRVMLSAVACTLLPLHAGAQAQWPSRPINIVVPFVPGGSNDNIARVLAVKLGGRLGQPVVVDNKGGGGGTIGTDFVARSSADGYTLLFVSGSIATNVASGKKLPFDLMKDLESIGGVAATPFVIVVGNEVKATTLKEFIGLAAAKPKSLNYGTAGIGGINHLGTELFASAAKVQLTHIPYKGIGPAFNDLMGSNLQMLLPTLASVAPHIQGGKMRGLAVTSMKRSPMLPEIPTANESGLPGFELEVWFGLLGPAGMPPGVVKRLNNELNTVLALPEFKEILAREGATPKPSTPTEFGNLIRSDITRWTRLIKDTGIQIE